MQVASTRDGCLRYGVERKDQACGCNGLWPLVVESLWLHWPVAAGYGKPLSAMACGRWLWKALAVEDDRGSGPIIHRTVLYVAKGVPYCFPYCFAGTPETKLYARPPQAYVTALSLHSHGSSQCFSFYCTDSYFSCIVVLLLPAVPSPSSTSLYDKTYGNTTTSLSTMVGSARQVDDPCRNAA